MPERLLACWFRLSSSLTPRPRCVLRKFSLGVPPSQHDHFTSAWKRMDEHSEDAIDINLGSHPVHENPGLFMRHSDEDDQRRESAVGGIP